MSIESFTLLDDTSIPWIAWGNGSGKARASAIQSGLHALKSGFTHIDTAQGYFPSGGQQGDNERATGEFLKQSGQNRESLYITTKISEKDGKPVAVQDIPKVVQDSIDALGTAPNLILIHNPYVTAVQPDTASIRAFWHALEALKVPGGPLEHVSIGVSNFRPQDLLAIIDDPETKHLPVVNQLEYHPYVLSHLEPVLAIQAKHGIRTAAYGPLTPAIRHPNGGPLKPVLDRIAARLDIEQTAVLLLWARAKGAVVVSASGNNENISKLAEVAKLPSGLLTDEEVQEIERVGKTIYYRHYHEHMEADFAVPDLPDGTNGTRVKQPRSR